MPETPYILPPESSLPWVPTPAGEPVGQTCRLSWSLADRPAREQLRRHVLLCSALDGVSCPRPKSMGTESQALHYRETLACAERPCSLASQAEHPLAAAQGLALARALGLVLLSLERCGVVHGHLVPDRVLWAPEAGRAWLLDFSAGGFLRAPVGGVQLRACRPHDDLRALGRLLLWRATGELAVLRGLPDATHTLGLVGIDQLSALDPQLLQIVRALLHAGGPAGYPSAQALCEDLMQRPAQWRPQGNGQAQAWPLPPDRIGRADELEALLQAFAEVGGRLPEAAEQRPGSGRPMLVVVDGRSGVGKTSVVQAACRTMARHEARVAEGKFNQFGHPAPLSALLEALDQALADAADHHTPQRQDIAGRVRTGLGTLASALAPSLPWLERLIGPQPTAPALTGEASRTRHELAVRRLVVALAGGDAPLVLFIDDLQWADQRSLDLLAGLLVEPRMSGLLLLGAYRSEAVNAEHRLSHWLHRLNTDAEVDLRSVCLRAWTVTDIEALLEAAKVLPGAERLRAAQALARLGQGNPYTTLQALRTAEQEGAIHAAADGHHWQVDAAALERRLANATVLSLVQGQLQRLPQCCREALSDSAHLGAAWPLETLSAARGAAPMSLCRDLAPALSEGLLRLVDDAVAPGQPLMLRFHHDVVQHAAHSLVAAADGDQVRLRLGRGLLQHAQAHGHLDQYLFAIVQQFNGIDAAACHELDAGTSVFLNERAGQLARAQGASLESLHYFMRAVAACRPGTWAETPRQAFVLYRQAAEAAYLSARFEVVDELLDLAATHGPDLLESAQFGELRVLVLLARNRLAEALASGRATLSALGVPLLPIGEPAGWPQVPAAHALDLTQASPPVIDAALRLLVGLTPCAFITSFETYARVIRTMIELAGQWPASVLTPLAWTNYGLTLCGMERRAEAFDAGELSLSLLDRVADDAVRCKVRVLCYGFLRHWRLPLAGELPALLQAYEDCLLSGDQEYLGYAAFLYCDKAYAMLPLEELAAGHALRSATVRQFGHDFSHHHCRVWLQGLRSLRGDPASQPLRLDGPSFSETQDLPMLAGAHNGFSLFTAHTLRAVLAWHRGDLPATREACSQALGVAANGTGTLLSVDLQVLCALSGEPPMAEQSRQCLVGWCAAAPANLQHKLDLVDATLAARAGDLNQALLLFERARDAAATGGFLRDQLLAEQGCGEALADAGQRAAARRWLEDAWATGMRWGALAVSENLLQRHAWLQPGQDPRDLESPAPLETRLSRWLEGSGAERVALRLMAPPVTLLAEQADGTLRVRLLATGEVDSALLPLRLLDQQAREGGALLLTRPAEDARWGDEPCFAQRRPALVWAGRIGAELATGQAYVECAGPRLLMTPRALEQTRQHVDGIVTALRARCAEDRLVRSRHIDAPTLLPNRAGFATLVELSLTHTRGHQELATVILMVRPRGVDSHGPEFGDREGHSPTLHEVVLRLQQPHGNGLAVGRLEHRLFGAVYSARPDRAALLSDARALLDRLEAPLPEGGRLLFEMAVCMDAGTGSAAELLARAERALAQATDVVSGIVVVDTPAAEPAAGAASLDLARDLDWALRHQGLRLVYQPIVDMTDRRLVSAEALVRWHHPAMGDIAPDQFVALAERSGLIRYLGRWVTDAVVQQVAHWRQQGVAQPRSVSFNASPLELLQPDYADHLIQCLHRARLDPVNIVLEITESASLQDDDSTRGNLAKLHQAGILMCIDDFGVGTSSLGRLHEVLARRLKIDRSFIEGVDRDVGRRTTVTMIIRLAESLALDVVAEGVGRPEEVQFLLSEGLRMGQGYYYARPLEVPVMDDVVRRGYVVPA